MAKEILDELASQSIYNLSKNYRFNWSILLYCLIPFVFFLDLKV